MCYIHVSNRQEANITPLTRNEVTAPNDDVIMANCGTLIFKEDHMKAPRTTNGVGTSDDISF
jgi:hypothetical protein